MSVDPASESAALPEREVPANLCWRCGKPVAAAEVQCPLCRAPLARQAEPTGPGAQAAGGAGAPLKDLRRVLVAMGIMLLVSLVGGLAVRNAGSAGGGWGRPTVDEALPPVVVLEAIDTLVVLWALWRIRVRPALPRKGLWSRLLAWPAFVPVLLALLAFNYGYHWLLREAGHFDLIEPPWLAAPGTAAAWFVALCVQPAIVEELFFRYLAIGVLRGVTGVHAAVMISAVMFGMAHLGVPLSIPVLIVLGVGLGYARIASGGLALPMAMHFAHNAAVLGLTTLCST
jgi:membrane protease YdiL (CAAX protease family)